MAATSSPFKFVLATALLASLAACSAGTGGSGGKETPGGGNAPDAVKPTAAGSFKSEKDGALVGGIPTKEFQVPAAPDCTNGNGVGQLPKQTFDSGLRVGQTFIEASTSFSTDSLFAMVSDSKVTEVGKRTTLTQTLSDFKMQPAPSAGIPASVKMIETCLDRGVGASPDCSQDYTEGVVPYVNGEPTTCWATMRDRRNTTGTASVGTYTMGSGQTVRAYQTTTITPVKISCRKGSGEEKVMGEGTEITKSIVTNEVVNRRPQVCYLGTELYSYSSLVLKDGQIVDAEKSELLAAPIR